MVSVWSTISVYLRQVATESRHPGNLKPTLVISLLAPYSMPFTDIGKFCAYSSDNNLVLSLYI